MAALLAVPHMVLSEPLHREFPAGLLARALMMHLPLSLVVASGKVHTEVSPLGLLLRAAALVDPGPRLPVRGQLDRGEAGELGHLAVSDVYIHLNLTLLLIWDQALMVLHSDPLRTQHRMLPPRQLPPGSAVILRISLVAGGVAGS